MCTRSTGPRRQRYLRAGLSIAVPAAAAATIAGGIGACSAGSSNEHTPLTRPPASRTSQAQLTAATAGDPVWMLTRSALSSLAAHPAIRAQLPGSRVLEILRLGQRPLPGVTAAPVVTFTSASALENAIRTGSLVAGAYGVLYDPEAWPFTPAAEQRDPVRAAARAAVVAHDHGLRLIVAPGLNLTTVLRPNLHAPRWREFLDLGLAGGLARIADAVELQAQSLERDTSTYAAFVQEATSQARAANQSIELLAGLSTNPPGAPVVIQQLIAAIRATRSMVDGYWLNIPGQGPRCPTCNPPRADLGIETLRAVR
jgi:hypothetical protein